MLENKVRKVLESNERTRYNDMLLQLLIWEQFYGFVLSEAQRARYFTLPPSESIRRTRQKLQERGEFEPPANVKKARQFKGMSVQQRMPKTKPEKVDSLLNERIPL